MQQWISQIFESGGFTLLMFPAAVLLGLITAIGSGCNIAILAAVAGYAAQSKKKGHSGGLFLCAGFVITTVIVLAVSGAVLGSVASIGRFGRLIAGFLMVLLGLLTLDLVPFKIPRPNLLKGRDIENSAGGVALGMTLGAASASCSLFCHAPLLMAMLGASAAVANPVLATANMTFFAVGFCIPMLAILLGVSMGRASTIGEKITKPLRYVGAVLLIAVGFYFLANL